MDERYTVERYVLRHGTRSWQGRVSEWHRGTDRAAPDAGLEGNRFSWWKEGRMVPRPLDATEDQLQALFKDSLQAGVFSGRFVAELRQLLDVPSDA